jgi:hypothetical protein
MPPQPVTWSIVDEVGLMQSEHAPNKEIVLQKLLVYNGDEQYTEYRFGWYTHTPGKNGRRWQKSPPLIPPQDLGELVKRARGKGWF